MKKILLALSQILILLLPLISACEESRRPPFLPEPVYVTPSEMKWNVRTDYQGLTPYMTPHTMHTRLNEGPLSELIPSNEYGMLLPYASASLRSDGSLRAAKYGLVTIEGMIVTDLIYNNVDKGFSRYSYGVYHPAAPPPPAYRLVVNVPGSETPWGGVQSKIAACALDGRWVTPFEYEDVIFEEKVIVMVRDFETFDMDVYDYNGRLLYNTLALDWMAYISKDEWLGSFFYSISEGYGVVPLNNGTYAFIDILTGRARYTEYVWANPFSNGFASVAVSAENDEMTSDLWGFIDKNFELVIPCKYAQPSWFAYERAVVQLPDSSQQIIGTRGETLFHAPSGYSIERHNDGPGFVLHGRHGEDRLPTFYTNDLVEISLPTRVQSQSGYIYLRYTGGGWYVCDFDGGIMLFMADKEYFFPDMWHISYTDDKYIIYSEYSETGQGSGVMTIDGRDIIPLEQEATITEIVEGGVLKGFCINVGGIGYFIGSEYMHRTYRLVDADGNTIASGSGVLMYDEASGLYSVLGADYYKWLDAKGNTIISIPLMSYTLD